MTRRIVFLIITVLIAPAWVAGADFVVVTEDFPPYNYHEKGKITGVSTEVVRAVMKAAGTAAEIKAYPWARAYKMALEEENLLIYSIGRIREREDLFKWVGVIAPCDIHLFKLKKRKDIRIDSLEKAKPYQFGILRGDMCLEYLRKKGIEKITVGNKDEDSIHMLAKGRVDLIPFAELAFVHKTRELGYDPSDFEKVWFLDELSEGLYMAFSKNTRDQLVEKFRAALKKIKSDGTYDNILNRYKQRDDK